MMVKSLSHFTYKKIKVILSLLIVFAYGCACGQQQHPFLICKKEEFQNLRNKGSSFPWNELKDDAMQTAAGHWNYDSEASNSSNCQSLANFMGACALAYILEPSQKEKYAQKVKKSILDHLDQLTYDEKKKWLGVVPPSNTLFVSTLSLDIVYDALASEEIKSCEDSIMAKMSNINCEGAWSLARYGLYGTWEVYKGKRTTPDNAYYNEIMSQITEEGVTTIATAYAFARLGSTDDRSVKTGYYDVLEFTGIDTRYYDNPKLEKFYNWLFSLGVTPFHWRTLIGDTHPGWGHIGGNALFLHALNVNPDCGKYLHWFLQDMLPSGNILSYVIPNHPLPQKEKIPSSQVYPDGGGWFRESTDDSLALMGVLYNIDGDAEYHTHKETNGIFLAGYGNYLTVNSGWLGITEAYKQNTLTINGEDHATKYGDGLEEGFTSEVIDYACGLDGPALPESTFKRNFFLVHSGPEHHGYYLVVDEVSANPSSNIKSYLHPATESSLEIKDQLVEYDATIDHHHRRDGVKLSVFYVTPPSEIQIDEQVSGYRKRVPDAGKHKRIEATYPVGDNGKKTIVTVLFPHDTHHQKAKITRINKPQYTGATVIHNAALQDVIMGSNSNQRITHNGIESKGNLLFARSRKGRNQVFFVRNGQFFSYDKVGFSSEDNVSILLHDKEGKIISQGTTVTFFHPEIQKVLLNGKEQKILESSKDKAKIWIPVGMHNITLVTSSN